MFKDQVKGQVIVDTKREFTHSMAAVYAGLNDAIMVGPDEIDKFGLKTLFDCRKDIPADKDKAYAWAIKELLPKCKKDKVFALLNYEMWNLDWIVYDQSFGFMLNCSDKKDVKILDSIMKNYEPNTMVCGWWYPSDFEGEKKTVDTISKYGNYFQAAGAASNVSFYNKIPALSVKLANPATDVKFDPNKKYVSVIFSEGDAIGWFCMSVMIDFFEQKSRANYMKGWQLTPRLYELTPCLAERYYKLANESGKDEFIISCSGRGYMNPSNMIENEVSDEKDIDKFLQETNVLAETMDMKSVIIYDYAQDPEIIDKTIQKYVDILTNVNCVFLQDTNGQTDNFGTDRIMTTKDGRKTAVIVGGKEFTSDEVKKDIETGRNFVFYRSFNVSPDVVWAGIQKIQAEYGTDKIEFVGPNELVKLYLQSKQKK
jgi:hypothetical protein